MTAILAFLILICVLVFVHEYGHFWAARRCGVKVLRFSIGFGKVLFQKVDKQGTEFVFSLIPLGGYVQMWEGNESINTDKTQSLMQKSRLQRAFIIIAGPMANLLFAVLAYFVVFSYGMPTLKPVIAEVTPNSIAAAAKLPTEFEIKQVDDKQVQDWDEVTLTLVSLIGSKDIKIEGSLIDESRMQSFYLDLSAWHIDSTKENPLKTLGIQTKKATIKPEIKQIIDDSPANNVGLKAGDLILTINKQPFDWYYLITEVKTGRPIHLLVQRGNEQKQLLIQPEKKDDRYIIGIVPHYEPLTDKYRTELKYDMLTALQKSIEKVTALIKTILKFIANLITGDLSLKNMSGPISMAKGAGTTAEIGWIYYLSFMALISVNLGIMNLFPILPLDGGQLVLIATKAIKGKPISTNFQLRFQQLGAVFVLALMIFTLLNDVIHF